MNYKNKELDGYLNFLTTENVDPLILTKESYFSHEKKATLYRSIFIVLGFLFFFLASIIYFKTHHQILKDEVSFLALFFGSASLYVGCILNVEREIVYSTSFKAKRRARYCLDTEQKIQLIQQKKQETLVMLKKINSNGSFPRAEKHDLKYYLLEQFSLYLSNLLK